MNDPRTTPARADLAAAHLKGKVEAPRFAEGALREVARGRVALRLEPSDASRMETELLFGERFTVYDVANGWAWGNRPSTTMSAMSRQAICTMRPMCPTIASRRA